MPTDFTLTVNPPALKWRVDPPAVDGRRGMQAQISTLSSEYVTVLVAAREGGSDVDLSANTVRFSFKDEGEAPEAGDWSAGSWDTDSSATPTRYYARILVGPDGEVLAAGTYVVWLEVTDDPETVVRPAGYVRVT